MLAALLAPRSAHAQTPPEAQGEDEPLRRFLHTAAAQSRRDRMLAALLDAAMASIVLPPGVILATRSDTGLRVLGATLLVRGARDVADLPFRAIPSTIEELDARYESRRAQGESPAVATAETEKEWREAVARERWGRPWWAVGLVVGTAEVATGMYFLLGSEGVASLGRQEQTLWGTVILAAGLLDSYVELCWLLGTSSLEKSWALYQSGRPGAWRGPRRGDVARPSFVIAPAAGGAFGALGLAV
jgi:hypothetical protein